MPFGLLPGDGPGDTRLPPDGPEPLRPDPPPDHLGPEREDAWERWREAYPVIFEIWRTTADERVCPICGPLAGLEFQAGHGPQPPLHHNCRCQRVTTRVEWRLR